MVFESWLHYTSDMLTNTNLRGQAVRIFLGKKGTLVREGVVLTDRGHTLLVEYRTGGAGAELGRNHVARRVSRSQVEVLDAALCRVEGTRGRVCGAVVGHVGGHDFVPQTIRED